MNDAEKILKKKANIKAELDKALPKAQSDALWQEATAKLDGFLARYSALPKGVHIHTDSRILPSAAIYLTVKDVVGPGKAYQIIEDAAVQGCAEIEKKLQRLMKLPGMQSLFIKAWNPLTKSSSHLATGFKMCSTRRRKVNIGWTLHRARIAEPLPSWAAPNLPESSVRTTRGSTAVCRG